MDVYSCDDDSRSRWHHKISPDLSCLEVKANLWSYWLSSDFQVWSDPDASWGIPLPNVIWFKGSTGENLGYVIDVIPNLKVSAISGKLSPYIYHNLWWRSVGLIVIQFTKALFHHVMNHSVKVTWILMDLPISQPCTKHFQTTQTNFTPNSFNFPDPIPPDSGLEVTRTSAQRLPYI